MRWVCVKWQLLRRHTGTAWLPQVHCYWGPADYVQCWNSKQTVAAILFSCSWHKVTTWIFNNLGNYVYAVALPFHWSLIEVSFRNTVSKQQNKYPWWTFSIYSIKHSQSTKIFTFGSFTKISAKCESLRYDRFTYIKSWWIVSLVCWIEPKTQKQGNRRYQTLPAQCSPTAPFTADRSHRLHPEIFRILFAFAWHTEWSLLLHDVIGNWMISFAANAAKVSASQTASQSV